MRMHDPIVAPTAMVYQDGAGVVHLIMLPGDRTIALMQGTIQALAAIARDAPLYVLVEIVPLATMSQAAFSAFAESPVMPHLRAAAFVGEKIGTLRIRASLDQFGPIAIPVMFCETKVESHAWVRARRGDAPLATEGA